MNRYCPRATNLFQLSNIFTNWLSFVIKYNEPGLLQVTRSCLVTIPV